MRVSRATAAMVGVCMAVVGVEAARAEETSRRILVMVRAEQDSLARRLEAELAQVGFAMVAVPARERPSREVLEALARKEHAAGAIYMMPSESAVEVWLVDRVTGKTSIRVLPAGSGPVREGIVAVRAVELLRASLLEIRVAEAPSGEVTPPPEARRLVEEALPSRPARISLHAAGSVAWSPGGVGPVGALALAGWGWLAPGLDGHLFVVAPVLPAVVREAEGRADVAPWLVGAGLRIRFAGGRVVPSGGAGIAAAFVRMSGTASPPFRGRRDVVVGAAPFLGAGLGVDASRLVTVRIDATGFLLAPWARVRFGDRNVAHWGRPAGLLAVGLELRVF